MKGLHTTPLQMVRPFVRVGPVRFHDEPPPPKGLHEADTWCYVLTVIGRGGVTPYE